MPGREEDKAIMEKQARRIANFQTELQSAWEETEQLKAALHRAQETNERTQLWIDKLVAGAAKKILVMSIQLLQTFGVRLALTSEEIYSEMTTAEGDGIDKLERILDFVATCNVDKKVDAWIAANVDDKPVVDVSSDLSAEMTAEDDSIRSVIPPSIVMSTTISQNGTQDFNTKTGSRLPSEQLSALEDSFFPGPSATNATSTPYPRMKHGVDPSHKSGLACMCGSILSSKISLRKHVQHFERKDVSCDQCNERFSWPFQLTRHVTKVHKKVMMAGQKSALLFRCRSCGAAFGTRSEFIQHNGWAHSESTSLTATTATASITAKPRSSTRLHDKVSTSSTTSGPDSKTHKCNVCEKEFLHRTSLVRHFRWAHPKDASTDLGSREDIQDHGDNNSDAGNHEGKQAHGIDPSNASGLFCFCGLRFSAPSRLRAHVNYYSPDNEKRFACDICESRFSEGAMLRKHKKVAHGINYVSGSAFSCSSCGDTFRSLSEVTRHRWRKHGRTSQNNKSKEKLLPLQSGSESGETSEANGITAMGHSLPSFESGADNSNGETNETGSSTVFDPVAFYASLQLPTM